MIRRLRSLAIPMAVIAVFGLGTLTQSTRAAGAAEHFTFEFYYKVRWGHFGEWMELYKKNHFPVLKRLQEMGRIVHMEAAFPVNHAGEADRWDLRFTIVYPDVATAHEDFDRTAILTELYPDQETFKKEDNRRFEVLVEHMDVPIWTDDLSDW